MKLQSLLCSPKLGQHCCFEVLQFLQSHPHVSGALALRSLCVSPKETSNLLLENCPNCVIAFAKVDNFSSPCNCISTLNIFQEKFVHENEWKYLIASLHKKVEQMPNDSPVRFLYSRIFTGML
jgi:hypothetical protein